MRALRETATVWVCQDCYMAHHGIRTDEQAFGYSVDKIYGGLNASSFTAEVRPVVAVTP